MLDGYHLSGVNEYLLVFRTDDPEVVRRIIERLCRTRDKDLCELAKQLESEWNDRERERLLSKTRGDNKKENPVGRKTKRRKNSDSKHGAKPIT